MNTIIYSHGFGVDATDRGLFTDIANSLPNFNHVTFDYNRFNVDKNEMTAATLDDQAFKLEGVVKKQISQDNEVTIIAHSQGCVIAAMVAPENVRRVIFLAPPFKFDNANAKAEKLFQREGVTEDERGNIYLPRRDGTTTKIPPEYFESRNGIDPIALYNQLALKSQVIIIRATQDEVLETIEPVGISPNVEIFDIAANHDFTGQARKELTDGINDILFG